MAFPWPKTNARRVSEADAAHQLAFLKAAVMTIVVDGRRGLVESNEFERFRRRVEWKLDAEAQLLRIEAETIEALQDAGRTRAFFAELGRAVTDDGVAEAIMQVCRDLASPEGRLGNCCERIFLQRLAQELDFRET